MKTQITDYDARELRKLALAHAVDVERQLPKDIDGAVPGAIDQRVLRRAADFEDYLSSGRKDVTGEGGT